MKKAILLVLTITALAALTGHFMLSTSAKQPLNKSCICVEKNGVCNCENCDCKPMGKGCACIENSGDCKCANCNCKPNQIKQPGATSCGCSDCGSKSP